jgi:hypothetical protein
MWCGTQEVSNDVTSQEIIAKEVTEFMLTAGSVRVSTVPGWSKVAQRAAATAVAQLSLIYDASNWCLFRQAAACIMRTFLTGCNGVARHCNNNNHHSL